MEYPIAISYKPENLSNFQSQNNAEFVINTIKGHHKCKFYYNAPDKRNLKRIRVDIIDTKWSFIANLSKEGFHLINPYIRETKSLDVILDDSFIEQDCLLMFVPFRNNPMTHYINNNFADRLPAIRNFLMKCFMLKKPIKPAIKEEEKEIWTAYCDGLNALNKEKRTFITIGKVGSPYLYNDTRFGEIYTIKLDFATSAYDAIPDKIKKDFSKYRVDLIDFSEDRNKLDIEFHAVQEIAKEEKETLDEYLSSFGYKPRKDEHSKVFKAAIKLTDLKDRTDILGKFETELDSAGIVFSNNKHLDYILESEDDVDKFHSIVDDYLEEIAFAVNAQNIIIPHEIKEDLQVIINKLKNTDRLVVGNKNFVLSPKSKVDYETIKTNLTEVLKPYDVLLDFPEYRPCMHLVSKMDKLENREAAYKLLDPYLSSLKKTAIKFEIDELNYRSMRFWFSFESQTDKDEIVHSLQSALTFLGTSFSCVINNPNGFTRISYEQDKILLEQAFESLKYEYNGEEIKLVDGKYYNDNFSSIEDTDNIPDVGLRDRFNRFMADCPTIGVCHKRSLDSVIVRLSDDFYNGERFGKRIVSGDMIFFPQQGSSIELRRQYDAIMRVNKPGEKVNGRKIDPPANPKLCNFLFSPLYASPIDKGISEMAAEVKRSKLEEHLNEKQIEAVAKSVLAKDIAFIQGPPGTGKTTVIAEIIWQEIKRNPKCKILLTSQTNLAVDNALERLKYQRIIRPLRVMSEQRTDTDDIIYNTNMLDNWVEHPDDTNKDNVVEQWIDTIIDRIDKQAEYKDVLKEWRDKLASKTRDIRESFVNQYKSNVNLVAATCSICGSIQFRNIYAKMYNTEDVEFDIVIMDEASKATPLEMAVPMVLGKKIIVIGDHKQLPPLMDENSIDTALEKIGRKDLAERIEDLKESQFKKLFEMAQKYNANLVTTLDTQYRMHRDIMMTINQFYEEELGTSGLICGIEDVMDKKDFGLRGSRYHGISCEPFISTSTHAIWVNVDGREERDNGSFSYRNLDEVKAVQKVVKALTSADGFLDYIAAQKKVEDKEIGIITFYSAQKRELRKIRENRRLNGPCDFRIDVVDRFQGMERNIVIVSTVRSNSYNGIGFAKEIERINVAFSRARSLLIVIGNRMLFQSKYHYNKAISAMETIDISQIEDLIKNN